MGKSGSARQPNLVAEPRSAGGAEEGHDRGGLKSPLLQRSPLGYGHGYRFSRRKAANALPKLHGRKRDDQALLCPMRGAASVALPGLRL